MDRSLTEIIGIVGVLSSQALIISICIGINRYLYAKKCTEHVNVKILEWIKPYYHDLPYSMNAECTYDDGRKEIFKLDGIQDEITPDFYRIGDSFEAFLDPNDREHYRLNDSFSFFPYIKGGIIGMIVSFGLFYVIVYLANRFNW